MHLQKVFAYLLFYMAQHDILLCNMYNNSLTSPFHIQYGSSTSSPSLTTPVQPERGHTDAARTTSAATPVLSHTSAARTTNAPLYGQHTLSYNGLVPAEQCRNLQCGNFHRISFPEELPSFSKKKECKNYIIIAVYYGHLPQSSISPTPSLYPNP